MNKQRLALTALVLLPLVVSCGTEATGGSGPGDSGNGAADVADAADAAAESPVVGVHWIVDGLTIDGETRQAPDGAYLEIAGDGQTDGSYGCNSFHATATVEGDRIDFEPAEATQMGCDEATMDFEEAFAGMLADGPLTAAPDGGALSLTTGDGDSVRLSEEAPVELHGTRWEVDSLISGDAAQSLPGDAQGEVWLQFDEEEGTVDGSLGCNSVSAPATVDDGQITLGSPNLTRRMCGGELMATERALLELFDGTVAYEIDHRALTLTGGNGEGVGARAAD